MARLRLAPINTGLYVQGESTPDNVDFFRARAEGGIDLCMVGNIAIGPNAVPNTSTGVMSPSHRWSALASAIRNAGSVPAVQLSATLPGYIGQRASFAHDPEQEMERYRALLAGMSEGDWHTLVRQFAKGIDLSGGHGFDHVQLHAAHGYAFSLALDPEINPTGRGLDALSSLLELLACRHQGSASLRVSWHTGLSHDRERQSRILQVWTPFRNRVELDLSNGYYNIDKRLVYPPHKQGEAPFLENAVLLAKCFPDASFVVSGNIWDPFKFFEIVPDNLHFGLARVLIADPQHLKRVREDKPMLCDDCGLCHYFSRGAGRITCPQWNSQDDFEK